MAFNTCLSGNSTVTQLIYYISQGYLHFFLFPLIGSILSYQVMEIENPKEKENQKSEDLGKEDGMREDHLAEEENSDEGEE